MLQLIFGSILWLGVFALYLRAEATIPVSKESHRLLQATNAFLIIFSLVLALAWWQLGSTATRLACVVHLILGIGLVVIFTVKVLLSSDVIPLDSGRLFRKPSTYEPAVLAFSTSVEEKHQPFGRLRRQHSPFTVATKDGINIKGMHVQAGHQKAIIIAHGAFRTKNTFPYVILAQWLAYRYDVFTFDFRGHGQSGGNFDFSENTTNDLRAVVKYARKLGYQKIGVFGRSMGAWTALIEAGSPSQLEDDCRIDALVAAAAPLRQITSIDTAQRVRRILDIGVFGQMLQPIVAFWVNIARGTRSNGICDAKICPMDVASHIRIPVLLIYQEYDWVIKTNVADAVEMYQALHDPKQLLLLAGPGHIFELASFHKLYQNIEDWFESIIGSDTTS